MDNEQRTAIINYALSIATPPHPPGLHSVAFGSHCAREEIAALVERRKETMRQRPSVTQSPCHQVTLSPLPPSGAFGDIRGQGSSRGEGEMGRGGEETRAQIGPGRAKFQLLRAKFELFRDI